MGLMSRFKRILGRCCSAQRNLLDIEARQNEKVGTNPPSVARVESSHKIIGNLEGLLLQAVCESARELVVDISELDTTQTTARLNKLPDSLGIYQVEILIGKDNKAVNGSKELGFIATDTEGNKSAPTVVELHLHNSEPHLIHRLDESVAERLGAMVMVTLADLCHLDIEYMLQSGLKRDELNRYRSTAKLQVVSLDAKVAQAKAMGAGIFFVGDASVCSDAHRGLGWGELGEILVERNRLTRNVISAVSSRGDKSFSFIEGKMDAKKFIGFIKIPDKDADKPILIITHNERYHRSTATQSFIEKHEGNIQVVFLAAYSPELITDKPVWNHAIARLRKRTIFTNEEIKGGLISILRSVQKQTVLIERFFRMKGTRYNLDAVAYC